MAAGPGPESSDPSKSTQKDSNDLDLPPFLRKRNPPASEQTTPQDINFGEWLNRVRGPAESPPAGPEQTAPAANDEEDMPDWLKGLGYESRAPSEKSQTPPLTPEVASGLPDWLKDPVTPVPATFPAERPAEQAVTLKKFSFQKPDAPASASVVAPPEDPAVVASVPNRLFSFQKKDSPIKAVPTEPSPAALAAAADKPVVEVEVAEVVTPTAESAAAPAEATFAAGLLPAVEIASPAVVLPPAESSAEATSAAGLPGEEETASGAAAPAPIETPAETTPVAGIPPEEEIVSPAAPVPEAEVIAEPQKPEDVLSELYLKLTTQFNIELKDQEGLDKFVLGSFAKNREFVIEKLVEILQWRNKDIPVEEVEKIANQYYDTVRQVQSQKLQAQQAEYANYVTERAKIAPPVTSGQPHHEIFAPDEPPISPSRLRRMESRGPDVLDLVRKIDASSRIIERQYWNYMAETLVDKNRLAYLAHVADTIAGSAGDIEAAVPLMSQIEGELRSAGYKRYKESVQNPLAHDPNSLLPSEETMLTLSERKAIRVTAGEMVGVEIILGVAGLDEKGQTDPMELVHDLNTFIGIEAGKVQALYNTIKTGQGTLAEIDNKNAEILEELRLGLEAGVKQRLQLEVSMKKESAAAKRALRKSKQEEIAMIENKYTGLPDPERTLAESTHKLTIARLNREILLLDHDINTADADVTFWEGNQDTLKNTDSAIVESKLDVVTANMAADRKREEHKLLPMTQVEREAYADGRLETALNEGQLAMKELEKWGNLIANRSGVIDQAASLIVSHLTQLDSLIDDKTKLESKRAENENTKDKGRSSRKGAFTRKINDIIARIEALQKTEETEIATVIPSRERISAEPKSTVGGMYRKAVLGGTVMIPNPDGKLEGVVKPGLYELAGYASLRMEIDARARALQEK